MKRHKSILSIAGSDPSGGAGIQADLKTFTVLGTYGAAVPTNLTIQNTLGVKACHPVSPEIVHDQILHVLNDLEVTHIKIGMIGNTQTAKSIVSATKKFKGEIIVDPVMKASDGSKLADSLTSVTMIAQRASTLTPNYEELCALTSSTPNSLETVSEACHSLFEMFDGIRCIIFKGGHFQENEPKVTDHLFIRSKMNTITQLSQSHDNVQSVNTHGTGCTYSSAFAAYHQKYNDDCRAFQSASQFVYRLIRESKHFPTGNGTGGLIHYLHNDPKPS